MISIITVLYHSDQVFHGFVESLESLTPLIGEHQLLVHDNTEKNVGLSRAINRLVSEADGDLVLFCNPDVIFNPTLQDMILFVRTHPGWGAVPKFIDSNVSRRFPTTTRIIAAHTWIGQKLGNRGFNFIRDEYGRETSVVEQPGGSFLLMRKEDVERLTENGKFYDEHFPVWWNDVDLAFRAKWNRIRFAQISSCQILHFGGHSVQTLSEERKYMLFYSNAGMMGFARKWKMNVPALHIAFFLDALCMAAVKTILRIGKRARPFAEKSLTKNMESITLKFRCTLH